jgi:hypothetical protein
MWISRSRKGSQLHKFETNLLVNNINLGYYGEFDPGSG